MWYLCIHKGPITLLSSLMRNQYSRPWTMTNWKIPPSEAFRRLFTSSSPLVMSASHSNGYLAIATSKEMKEQTPWPNGVLTVNSKTGQHLKRRSTNDQAQLQRGMVEWMGHGPNRQNSICPHDCTKPQGQFRLTREAGSSHNLPSAHPPCPYQCPPEQNTANDATKLPPLQCPLWNHKIFSFRVPRFERS